MGTKLWRQERTGGLSRWALSIICLGKEGGDETVQEHRSQGVKGHVNILKSCESQIPKS